MRKQAVAFTCIIQFQYVTEAFSLYSDIPVYICIYIYIYPTYVYSSLYYNKWGITVIYSLPEGYKGIYDPYIPPSGYYFDQSEPLF